MSHSVDAYEIVSIDAPCTKCGYSLRGLPVHAVCPECAHPVRLSLERRRLGLASPGYLATLNLGSGSLLLGLILAVTFGGISALQYTALGPIRYGVPLIVWPALDLVASTFVGFGVWKLTIDDPGLPAHDQARGNARALRAAAAMLPFVHLARVFVGSASVAPIAPVPPLLDAASGVFRAMVILGCWILLATGLCNLLRWLAARLPDPSLFSSAKSAGRFLPFIFIPAALGTAGLIPGALWLAILVGSAREKIARAA